MWPGQASNLGPLALESDALATALRGPARPRYMYMHYIALENVQFWANVLSYSRGQQ